jgi:putative cardiolipin synthase
LGGRNICDQYFGATEDIAFADIDVLSIGTSVHEVSNEFDSYWNAEHAYPINILVRQGTAQDLTDLRSRESHVC